MNPTSHYSLVKPTLETPFHIDFDWWIEHDANWRVFLLDFLCDEHHAIYAEKDQNIEIDYVDPLTAEVKRVDGLLHTLVTHCAKQEDFISGNTTLVNTIFKTFLANNNQPLNAQQLAERTGKSAMTILRTFSGTQIFKGIRPLQD
ncbi:MAG TPA: hypothetical protein DCK95_02780 [Anaerolineaceae bacterium]|uniref:Uncharacterized protein n=1 Tax=Anaerolinea thermophila TaxID=167964 RepID=A0A117LGX3_9CHLR|nr:MAG: hypothetical protein XD73_0554 [Anaerolinea thermophila]HAF61232.1 hypothetical protein [Anaerolineaceae bacterium]